MERTASLLSFSSRSSSHASTNRNNDPLLPYAENVSEMKPIRGPSIFGRFLYRRILLWTVVSLVLVSFALFKASDGVVTEAGSSRYVQPYTVATTTKSLTPQPTIIGNEDGGPVLVIVDGGSHKNKESQNKPGEKTEEGKTESSDDKKPAEEEKKKEEEEKKKAEEEKKKEEEKEKLAEQDKEKDNQKSQAPIDELSAEEDAEAQKKWDEDLKKMPWLIFPQ